MKRLPALLAVLCMTGLLQAADTRPNIVVILADDMGYGDVQALNEASTIPTPNLNGMADAGMSFIDAHSPSAVCTPTRYALMTGRYCWRSRLKRGVLGGYSKPLLEPGRSTIADLLKRSGYLTGMVGKWHLGMQLPMKDAAGDSSQWDGDPGVDFSGLITDAPVHHGFDSSFGVTASLDMPPYVWVRNDRFTMPPTIQQPAVAFPHFVRAGPRAPDLVIDEALDELSREAVGFIADAAAKDEPYFLYVPLTGPHKPALPHGRFRGKTGLSEYGDFVHQVDWTVGQILNAVDASSEADNTVVFYTSDNGSYMRREPELERDHVEDVTQQAYRPEHHTANGDLRGTKADIWEAGHRVPFFVRWPDVVKAGSVCDTTICHTDIYATCAAIVDARLSQDEAEDSCSLSAILNGNDVSRGAPVIHHSSAGMFAIRDGKWKLVAGNGSGGRQKPKGKPFGKPYQLYDLQTDLSESTDVASEHPDVVRQLTTKLEQLRDAGRSVSR